MAEQGESYAEVLRALLKKYEITQQRLARAASLSSSAISHLVTERYGNAVSVETLVSITEAFAQAVEADGRTLSKADRLRLDVAAHRVGKPEARYKRFGAALRDAMKDVTIEAFADCLGLERSSAQLISQWRMGVQLPAADKIVRILGCLDESARLEVARAYTEDVLRHEDKITALYSENTIEQMARRPKPDSKGWCALTDNE